MEPWVEKYRPSTFQSIVLEKINQQLFQNMIDKMYIPNLLFYGPPGTGKTTTILNLIKLYQEKEGQDNPSLIIHLNASDERGIDTIRSQIYSFVHSNALFVKGTKFVILDEVDSMTKSAQQALGYLLHKHIPVRFCLICNYISKIDETLQTLFIKIKFNSLPIPDILSFLQTIVEKEKLSYTPLQLQGIQRMYGNDIRSMVNYLQMNQYKPDIPIQPEDLCQLYGTKEEILSRLKAMSIKNNMDPKHILKEFLYQKKVAYYDFVSLETMVSYLLFMKLI